MHGKGTYVDGKGEIFEGEFFNGNGAHSPLSPSHPAGRLTPDGTPLQARSCSTSSEAGWTSLETSRGFLKELEEERRRLEERVQTAL